ncbi:MAG: D-serine ammonia-lyase [Atopostipes suicloacalis]|nr:D-serine ammonia-lyase [Atopostipes suicloacalis]
MNSNILKSLKNEEEIFWLNPRLKKFKEAKEEADYTMADIEEVEARFQRFAPFIQKKFPETKNQQGILESEITEIGKVRQWLEEQYDKELTGQFFIKRDDLLAVSGTVKSRGAIYEVLKHAEELAIKNGLLKNIDENYEVFASEKFEKFFSNYNLTVGTTGNLGISVGAMGRALGFQVTVHMSEEAKDWKKNFLKKRNVEVIEHKTNFTAAVTAGRKAAKEDPKTYFVDDEHSVDLFLGYTVGGYRMKKQLEDEGVKVDADHPLFVYLPCGIGGSPSGITFGLKHAFGDHVHCFFAEPTKMPSMVTGLESQKFDKISVEDLNLGGLTVADGLAVPRTSGLVAKLMNHYFSGGYTLKDNSFQVLLTKLFEKEGIFLEPAAVAGLAGAFKLLTSSSGKEYIKEYQLQNKLKNATHIAWGTGGSMVPTKDRSVFIAEGKGKELF